jgi:signal transduction histidine kinase
LLSVSACQSTQEGGNLTLSIHRHKGMVVIAMKDTDVGIPAENVERLLDPLFIIKPRASGLV